MNKIASTFSFVELAQECDYDEYDDDVNNQETTVPNQNGTNSQFDRPFDNPYYEAGSDGFISGNDRPGKNPMNPDLIDTCIVTATQNVYYDL